MPSWLQRTADMRSRSRCSSSPAKGFCNERVADQTPCHRGSTGKLGGGNPSTRQTWCRWIAKSRIAVPLAAPHSLVGSSLSPRLTLHPPPTPSSASDEAISTTDLTVQAIARLHHGIEWGLIARQRRKWRGIEWRGIVHEIGPSLFNL